MNIVILDASRKNRCTLKDVAGGFGTAFAVGSSPMARVLEAAKRRIAALPNIVLAYLDALLTSHGAVVRVLHVHDLDALVPADLYLISSSIVECRFEREIARAAKRRFGCRVGVFGTFASEVPWFFEEVADFVVKGEIENIAPDLARSELPEGLVSAGFVSDIASLPFPRWDQFELKRFRYQVITRRGITLPMLGSRGCPETCNYCPYLVNSRHRARPVENILDEMDYLVREYGAYGISFRDPNFTFDTERTCEFGEQVLRRGLDVRWSMEARTDHLDPELLGLLYRAGLRSVEVGVESVDDDTLRGNLRRPTPKPMQEGVIEACHRLGIRVIANYTLGLPNDTMEGIARTVRYAKKLNTFAIQFTITTPYPGTRMYHDVKGRIFEKDWERFDGWTSVFHHAHIPADELHRVRESAYVSYHLRPRYAWRFLRSTLLYPLLHPEPRPNRRRRISS